MSITPAAGLSSAPVEVATALCIVDSFPGSTEAGHAAPGRGALVRVSRPSTSATAESLREASWKWRLARGWSSISANGRSRGVCPTADHPSAPSVRRSALSVVWCGGALTGALEQEHRQEALPLQVEHGGNGQCFRSWRQRCRMNAGTAYSHCQTLLCCTEVNAQRFAQWQRQ